MKIKNIDELLCDDSFLSWYFQKEQDDIALWDSLIKNNPEQKELVGQAILVLESIKIKEENIEPVKIISAENRLFEKISDNQSPAGSMPAPVRSISKQAMWRWVAAAIFLVVGGLGLFHYFKSSDPIIETGYAQVKKQSLPDGSQVTLNANSKLTYAKNWEKEEGREVWLNGEAFFSVEKTLKKSKFIVHTDHFDIVVTGTEFNVVNRSDRTNVLLKEGSITIRTINNAETIMKPGDFVEINNNRLQRKEAKDIQVLAWKDRKFIFEKTPMKEVGASINDLYGFNVKFGDAAAASDSISGIVPNDNLDIFLQYLETSQNYEITKDKQDILISTKR